jgi:hypothetical protein
MSMVYFTIVAIILYVTADWLLERVEVAAGRRLKSRCRASPSFSTTPAAPESEGGAPSGASAVCSNRLQDLFRREE